MSSFFVFQKSIDAEHLISVFHFSRIQKRKKIPFLKGHSNEKNPLYSRIFELLYDDRFFASRSVLENFFPTD
ncbi:hypothetical protein LEP1GSC161_1292 [Leptospira santarosai str. CBC1416]|uniref:Uncharacterized protein n=1 Tax=Leptospira santarosai str. CBC1416 TaxID=1193059 RepID=M6VPY1_9LEPT|nr:hypothetical protein LEP1GSC169_1405 [Leptospira santarosai str. HAI1349]EMO13774.1 hypothetical protein LEP1GSC165_3559 [Leptospira santarosai str. CBC523]EMO33511.1 hypothetical protein LEP1GSC175_2587 [Leptospira santarosai str. HAI821]EMO59552.1 hypothetical protein LEP1GSC161_1292 [Leptospira santarosai str. CBC1416]EMO84305.1 hypothetical protein LEP1GSC070_3090 [Leptospira santarosai str. AIM]EMP01168.1 hypothetical protein LEP1GSC171_3651 [Leptospira santarosai str. HAI1380]EMP8253